MKIAFINKYQGKVNRGAETFVREVASRLLKNHEVDILTNVNFKKYNVVIPTNGRLQAFVVRLVTWMLGSKMVVSGQSGIGLDDRINLYSFPDAFVALSEYAYKWAKGVNPFIKTVKIPNGANLKRFGFKGDTLQGSRTILTVGAFTKEKRHDLTIKAVGKLKGVKLIIVGGGGNLRSKIKDLGYKMLGKDRFEIKSVPNEKMSEVYGKADVFAYSTVPWESFGIAMVEAMASGLPVVATDDPIRREIVGNAGLFVDPTDTDAYNQALSRALEINWGDKPRKQAEKFSWDKIAEQYEQLFFELVSKK